MPEARELPDRLDAALTVIHLLFTTGHTAPSGEMLTRDDLAALHATAPAYAETDWGQLLVLYDELLRRCVPRRSREMPPRHDTAPMRQPTRTSSVILRTSHPSSRARSPGRGICP